MQDTPFHYMAVGFLLYILGQGVENVIVGEYWEGVKFLGASLIGLWAFKPQVKALGLGG